jgi:hypothetical protein
MANRGLDTGEFNEYGEWRKFEAARGVESGPSPIPLLALAVLIALIMLLRSEGEPGPQRLGTSAWTAGE